MSVTYNELYLVWYRPQLLYHCRTRVSSELSFIGQWVPRILWLWNVYPLVRLFASKAARGQSRTSSSAPSWKATKHYLRRVNKINMSAIKTHDVYNVIHGDDLVVAQEGEEKRFKVTSMLLQRDRPSVCQIFTATENTGSLASSETKAFNCKVVSTEPSQHSTKFNLKAVVGTETQEIALTSVKTQSSECTICWLNWIFCFDYIYNVYADVNVVAVCTVVVQPGRRGMATVFVQSECRHLRKSRTVDIFLQRNVRMFNGAILRRRGVHSFSAVLLK